MRINFFFCYNTFKEKYVQPKRIFNAILNFNMIINIRRSKKKGFKNYTQEALYKQKKVDNLWKPICSYRRKFWVWNGKYSGSKKEKEIYSILRYNNIKFYCEVCFDRSTNKRFDFYLPDFDVVIEYDGAHHFGNIQTMDNDIFKESMLEGKRIRLFRYNKTDRNLNDCIYKDLKEFLN